MNSIRVEDVSMSFGKTQALRNVSLDIQGGELFGLIGPDGAGKSTLFRIVATLLKADEGNAFISGMDVFRDYKKIRDTIGYMPGRFSLYQDLTVEENLDFFATIFRTTLKSNYNQIKEIYIQLEPFKKRPAGKLSGGMKQKLALCCALIHKPDVLLLDEPTTGVDPVSRKEFWQMLKRLNNEGITILVSTPYMDEAARCNRIALMQGGKILAVSEPENIRKLFHGKLIGFSSGKMYPLLLELRKMHEIVSAVAFGDHVHATVSADYPDPERLCSDLRDKGFSDVQAEWIKPGIENVFMQLLNNEEILNGDGN